MARTVGPQSAIRSQSRDRGQVLVIVAIGMVALIAMAGLITDAGIAWANRRQAQNLADAAALAGTRIIATDRYQKIYDPSATPTFADPGTAIEQAILNAYAYDANGGQAFTAPTWGVPGSPEYTDYKGRRFPNAEFPTVGPLYIGAGSVPGQAQGVWVPVTSQSNTMVMKIVGISSVSIGTSAGAVTGPSVPLGKLLPLVVRDRYTKCADESCQPPVGPAPPIAYPPPVFGQNHPLPGPTPYQRTYQEGCQYNFRETNPAEIPCNGITDPAASNIGSPGNFGWLSWTGGAPSDASLVPWIDDPATAPTAWYSTPCANANTSETCRVSAGTLPAPRDDLFWRIAGTTGNKHNALTDVWTKYQNKEVYVPIWRSIEDPGNGSHSQFEVIGFGVFRVDNVISTGNNQGFTGTYLGSFRGGAVQECTIVPQNCGNSGSGSAPFPFAIDLAK